MNSTCAHCPVKHPFFFLGSTKAREGEKERGEQKTSGENLKVNITVNNAKTGWTSCGLRILGFVTTAITTSKLAALFQHSFAFGATIRVAAFTIRVVRVANFRVAWISFVIGPPSSTSAIQHWYH